MMAVTGLNHLTLAVADLDRAVTFYRDLLGCRLRARWPRGAYLETGSLWLCLTLAPGRSAVAAADYSHIAFDVAPGDFAALSARIAACCPIWQGNHSEGASLYFLDPDGYRLEIHVGSLDSRLAHYRARPDSEVEVWD